MRSSPLPAQVPPVPTPEVTPLPEPVTDVTRLTQPAVTAVTPGHASSTVSCGSHEALGDPVPPLPGDGPADDDLTQVARDIAAGHVHATVADIRSYLGCSQARATALRRQLAGHDVTT